MVDVLRKSIVLLDALSGGADSAPPSEFRLFKAGVNETDKGSFVFDRAAANRVMSMYRQRGVDMAIDLEHLSLDPKALHYNPDAMGWFGLEDRNGELWAVNVRWNDEGMRRLNAKTQRYISPAFLDDGADRIDRVFNIALVAQPATHQTQPLIAASQSFKELSMMTPEQVQKVVDAIANEDIEAMKTLLMELMAGALAEETPTEADPALAEMTDAAPELLSATGATTIKDALATVAVWAKSSKETADKAATIELASRMTLVGDLVKLGAETPATAYTEKDGKKVLVPRLLSEDFASMRHRVSALKAAKPELTNSKPPVKLSSDRQETPNAVRRVSIKRV